MENKIRKDRSLLSILFVPLYYIWHEKLENGLLPIILLLSIMISPAQSAVLDGKWISAIKRSVLIDHKSTTVGNAMDNWKLCDNHSWGEFETDNKQKIVQFNCEITDFREMKRLFSESNKELENFQNVKYMKIVIQWRLNLDNTFETSYANMEAINWKDGTGNELSKIGGGGESDNDLIDNYLDMAYNNDENILKFVGYGIGLRSMYDAVKMAEKYVSSNSGSQAVQTNSQVKNNQQKTSFNEHTQPSDYNKNLGAYLQILQNYLRKNDKQGIAKLVQYPLARTSPLPAIQTQEEFVNKFDYIFDDTLKQIILRATAKDITRMGSRGDMLKDGTLWFRDVKIIAINYQSDKEKKFIQNINTLDKNLIHKSLKIFEKNVLLIETKKFKIRIDKIEDFKYRYASWNKKQTESEKPNLILYNGKLQAHGTGGDYSYIFTNGAYEYEIAKCVIGCEDPNAKGYLIVYKNGKQIVEQDIVEVK